MITIKMKLLAFIFIISSGVSLSAELVAPVYPGSEPARHEVSGHQEPYLRVFYSKDPLGKVLAFYEEKLGEMEEVRHGHGQTFRRVVARPRFLEKASLKPDWMGVSVHTRKPRPGEESDEYQSQATAGMDLPGSRYQHHDFFEYIKNLAAQLPDKTWSDYDKVCDRFGHLTWSFFMEAEKTDSRGRKMNVAQAMIDDHVRKNPGLTETQDSGEELAAQMEILMQQGRMNEAMQLATSFGQQMQEALEPDPDSWYGYIELLEAVEKHAFLTRISIHRKFED